MAGITLQGTVKVSERAVVANFKRRHDPRYGDLYRQSTHDAIDSLRALRKALDLHGYKGASRDR